METTPFQAAVKVKDWAAAADMVRRHLKTSRNTDHEKGSPEFGDQLIDWMTEGRWDGTETPESVASEWDAVVGEGSGGEDD